MKNTGFTVTEMLVTLFLFSILLFLGIPSFQGVYKSSTVVSNTNIMTDAFNYARSEAIKRGNFVQLGQRVNSSWTGGLVVWADLDTDGALDVGEELRLWRQFKNGSTVDSSQNRTNFVFQATGEVNNVDELTICDNRVGERGRKVSILKSGAIIIEKVICG